MSLQLSINESSNIIVNTIKWAGENLNVDLHHVYSTLGNQGFYVEISDHDLARKLNRITDDYYKDDHTFSLNIPYEYFNQDEVPNLDTKCGLHNSDLVEVKAELRCMNAIQTAYNNWIKTHQIFTTKDLQNIINHALDKLRVLKNIDLNVRANGNEFAEKYIVIHFTWAQLENWLIRTGKPYKGNELFFEITFNLKDYYDDVGKNVADGLIGEGRLSGKNRYDVCLLRVAYLLYAEATGFLQNHWPHLYSKYLKGEF